jgi:hypothetical protein
MAIATLNSQESLNRIVVDVKSYTERRRKIVVDFDYILDTDAKIFKNPHNRITVDYPNKKVYLNPRAMKHIIDRPELRPAYAASFIAYMQPKLYLWEMKAADAQKFGKDEWIREDLERVQILRGICKWFELTTSDYLQSIGYPVRNIGADIAKKVIMTDERIKTVPDLELSRINLTREELQGLNEGYRVCEKLVQRADKNKILAENKKQDHIVLAAMRTASQESDIPEEFSDIFKDLIYEPDELEIFIRAKLAIRRIGKKEPHLLIEKGMEDFYRGMNDRPGIELYQLINGIYGDLERFGALSSEISADDFEKRMVGDEKMDYISRPYVLDFIKSARKHFTEGPLTESDRLTVENFFRAIKQYFLARIDEGGQDIHFINV